jgi:glucosylceramidase
VYIRNAFLLIAISAMVSLAMAQKGQQVSFWLTKPDRSVLFAEQKPALQFGPSSSSLQSIVINDQETYQSIDGFGFALTGGSAIHMIRMNPESRATLIRELFDTSGSSIGVSYLRISIGASDLNEKVFSYDDLPTGATDENMKHFDLGPDRADVIPILKEILAVNPHIKILGSPWSPPAWMKTNGDTRGGRLRPEFYRAYATYFVKYVQAMKAEGITIDAITIQNEPLHPGNNPSLLMPAPDQAEFIKNHLGPAFKAARLTTKIIIYDHNADRPDYPIFILNDPEARKYVDGSAFHLYGGNIEALSDVRDAHPDKHLYFTEQMVVDRGNGTAFNIASPVRRLIIGATRNWCRNVLEWNLAADPENRPYTDRGGCSMCQGAVTIDGNHVSRNLAYYSIAHASKFVRPGSVRIGSTNSISLPNVAFKRRDGKIVLIVVNDIKEDQSFNIQFKGQQFVTTLNKGAVGTYVW